MVRKPSKVKNRSLTGTCVVWLKIRFEKGESQATRFDCCGICVWRNNYNQGKRRSNTRASRAQREDSIRCTVYVSDINQQVTEERLAALFSSCGQVVDCRICGDPHSVLGFAFVEFADEYGARAAISLSGTVLGYYLVRVLPSKTAILPVNPTFLPLSEDGREMCTRTVYCTNIDQKVSQADVNNFFESTCGEVACLRLLGDNVHSTRIAFVEFAMVESAIIAFVDGKDVISTIERKETVLVRLSLSKEWHETTDFSFVFPRNFLLGKRSETSLRFWSFPRTRFHGILFLMDHLSTMNTFYLSLNPLCLPSSLCVWLLMTRIHAYILAGF